MMRFQKPTMMIWAGEAPDPDPDVFDGGDVD